MGETAGIEEKDMYRFRLFITGMSVKSLRAVENLNTICETHLPGRYHIELIDLVADKSLAIQYQIIAIPTLVKLSPEPVRTIVGDLSDTKKVLTILEIE